MLYCSRTILAIQPNSRHRLSFCVNRIGILTRNLTAGLCALFAWGILQIFVPLGQTADTIYALLGAILFSGFIVFDTAQLIQTYDLDQYIWASVNLYLE